jgi:hypothetical protein
MARASYRGISVRYNVNSPNELDSLKKIVDQYHNKKALNITFKHCYAFRQLVRSIFNRYELKSSSNMFINENISTYILIKQRKRVVSKVPKITLTTEESLDTLKYFNQVLSDSLFGFVMFSPTMNDFDRNNFTKKTAIPLWDLGLETLSEEKYHLKDDNHLNDNGHILIANSLFHKIFTSNLIPKEFYRSGCMFPCSSPNN